MKFGKACLSLSSITLKPARRYPSIIILSDLGGIRASRSWPDPFIARQRREDMEKSRNPPKRIPTPRSFAQKYQIGKGGDVDRIVRFRQVQWFHISEADCFLTDSLPRKWGSANASGTVKAARSSAGQRSASTMAEALFD